MSHTLLGKQVGPIGYGMMGLTWHETTQSTEDEKFTALKTALDAGATAWNGGEFYGTSVTDYNSLTLLKKYFAKYPEDAAKVSINIKGGAHLPIRNDNSPAYVRQSIQNCLSILEGTGAKIDMFEMARRVSQQDYLESLRVIQEFVDAGKIGGVALSEVNAATIRQASKIVKVAAVEIELSLFETAPLTNGICGACAELDIPIFAYSPLGRGFLSGKITKPEEIPQGSFARVVPRLMQQEHFEANMRIVQKVREWASSKEITPAQFAINWVSSLSGRPGMPNIVIPIPGAASKGRILENSVVCPLPKDVMDEVDEFLGSFEVSGARLPEAMVSHMVDSNTSTEV